MPSSDRRAGGSTSDAWTPAKQPVLRWRAVRVPDVSTPGGAGGGRHRAPSDGSPARPAVRGARRRDLARPGRRGGWAAHPRRPRVPGRLGRRGRGDRRARGRRARGDRRAMRTRRRPDPGDQRGVDPHRPDGGGRRRRERDPAGHVRLQRRPADAPRDGDRGDVRSQGACDRRRAAVGKPVRDRRREQGTLLRRRGGGRPTLAGASSPGARTCGWTPSRRSTVWGLAARRRPHWRSATASR
jgi:hypothetical protein